MRMYINSVGVVVIVDDNGVEFLQDTFNLVAKTQPDLIVSEETYLYDTSILTVDAPVIDFGIIAAVEEPTFTSTPDTTSVPPTTEPEPPIDEEVPEDPEQTDVPPEVEPPTEEPPVECEQIVTQHTDWWKHISDRKWNKLTEDEQDTILDYTEEHYFEPPAGLFNEEHVRNDGWVIKPGHPNEGNRSNLHEVVIEVCSPELPIVDVIT